MAQEKAFVGTDVKFLIDICSPGFKMSDDDFSVTLSNGTHTETYAKNQMVTDPEGNYYVCFSTTSFGKGLITATVTASVPDNDFTDHYREEIARIELVNVVK